jgi:hypothetical protein
MQLHKASADLLHLLISLWTPGSWHARQSFISLQWPLALLAA